MRSIFLLAAAATLGSCTMNNGPVPIRQVAGPDTVSWLLGGKTASTPIRCLPSYNRNDMVVLDSQTIAFRDGGTRTYVMHLSPGCGELANGGALVTRSWGTNDLCTGDIARVYQTSPGMFAGSCSIGAIVPYNRAPKP